jgi:hypothetical protein
MKHKDDITYDVTNLASMSECTGLIPSAIEDEEQANAYGELYGIHQNYKRDDYNEVYEDDQEEPKPDEYLD